ncbi:MAG: phosphatidate cytidylyltransferase [Promethearchaeia archaeon]
MSAITVSFIIVNQLKISSINFIIFPFDLMMIVFIAFFLPVFYLLMIREKRKKTNYDKNDKNKGDSNELPLKYDIYRKLAHLVVLTIILFYFTLGFLVKNFLVNILTTSYPWILEILNPIFELEKEGLMIFTQYLVVFLVGISLIGLMTADIVRILKPELYPLKPVNRILREKEKESHMRFGPQISMAIGCFSIIILFGLFQPIGPLVICTTMTMAILSDISSNLIGRVFGAHHIRDTRKTYEGLFAGIITAYISGILILILLRGYFIISILGFFLIPLIGSLLIGSLDYLNLDIDDNLSYNVLVTTVLFFIAIFIA